MNNYLFWKRFAQGKLKTHVSSVKIRIPSPKEILSWSERRLPNSTLVGKIDNAHTVEHDTLRPVSGGLFCERIFGPISTNVCACLRRKGWNEEYCKICEVQFTKSRLRRYQMGHILLAAPVIHVWALQGGYLSNLLGKKNLGIRLITYGKVMCQSKLWDKAAINLPYVIHDPSYFLESSLSYDVPFYPMPRRYVLHRILATMPQQATLRHSVPKVSLVKRSTSFQRSSLPTVRSRSSLPTVRSTGGSSSLPTVRSTGGSSSLTCGRSTSFQRSNLWSTYLSVARSGSSRSSSMYHKSTSSALPTIEVHRSKVVVRDRRSRTIFSGSPGSQTKLEATSFPYFNLRASLNLRSHHKMLPCIPATQSKLVKGPLTQKTQIENSYYYELRSTYGRSSSTDRRSGCCYERSSSTYGRSLSTSFYLRSRAQLSIIKNDTNSIYESVARPTYGRAAPTFARKRSAKLGGDMVNYIPNNLKNKVQKVYERGNVLPFHQFILYKPDTFNKITQFFGSLNKKQVNFPLPCYSKQKLIFCSNKIINKTYSTTQGYATYNSTSIAPTTTYSRVTAFDRPEDLSKFLFTFSNKVKKKQRSIHQHVKQGAHKTIGNEYSTNPLITQTILSPIAITNIMQPNQGDTVRDFGVFNQSDSMSWGIFCFYNESKFSFKDKKFSCTQASSPLRSSNYAMNFYLPTSFALPAVEQSSSTVHRSSNRYSVNLHPSYCTGATYDATDATSIVPTSFYETHGRSSSRYHRRASTMGLVETHSLFTRVNLKNRPISGLTSLDKLRKTVDRTTKTYRPNKLIKNKPLLTDIKNIAYTGSSVIFQSLKNLNLILLDSLISWRLKKSKAQLDCFLLQNKLTKKKRNLRNKLAKSKIILTKRNNLVQSFLSTKQLPEWMVISILPILPPALRPILELEPNNVVVSDLNVLYQTVIRRNDALMGLLTFRALEIDILNRQVSLQQAIEKLFDKGAGTKKRPVKSLSQGFHGKKGLFRSHLLGKRVDYSGRSVIVVGPQLKLHECGLPKEMALVLFLPFLIARLKKRKIVNNTSQAKQLILQKDKQIWIHLKSLMYEHPVLLNRAPTLHRLGFQAFQPILVSGKAMILPALVCTGFNADFDGDQMAVHVPLSHAARAESWKLLHAKNNMLSPATGRPIIVLSQEMILGCYCSSLIWNNSFKKKQTKKQTRFRLPTSAAATTYPSSMLMQPTVRPRVAKLSAIPRRASNKSTYYANLLEMLYRRSAVPHRRSYLPSTASDLPTVRSLVVKAKLPLVVGRPRKGSLGEPYSNFKNFKENKESTARASLGYLTVDRSALKTKQFLNQTSTTQNFYFTNFQEIYKALGQNKISIQTAVWLRIPFFEDNQFLEEPLEIRLDAKGHFFRSYCQSQRHFSKNIKSQNQLKGISYIRTSAGRIQLNETFYSSWS